MKFKGLVSSLFGAALIASYSLHAIAGMNIIKVSSARTSTYTSADINKTTERTVHVIINVTVWSADALTPKIQALSPVTGLYYDLLVGVAMSATGTQVLKIGSGFGIAANASSADMIPDVYRVVVTHAGATTTTYSVTTNTAN